MEKICKTCGIEKELSDFPYVATRNVYGSHCKPCFKTKRSEYDKQYHINNQDKKRQYAKEYHKNNREKGLEYRRERYLTYNREEQLAKRKKWYQDNKERHAENRSKYESTNKDRLRAARREWENKRLSEDVNYKLHKVLAGRVRFELKGVAKRTSRTEQLIGCSIPQLKVHIESQFTDGMTWDNWGTNGWHIDHKIPVSWFNLENEHCRKLAFNYMNLQPLWGKDNIAKKNNYSHKVCF